MLDALWKPALSPSALPALISALIAQLGSSRPIEVLLAGSPNLAQRWVDALREKLEEGHSPPAVADSADALGVSTRTLQRACLTAYGLPPVALRRILVAQAARQRIALGEAVARVSTDLGFSSSGHLGRLLRAIDATQDLPGKGE